MSTVGKTSADSGNGSSNTTSDQQAWVKFKPKTVSYEDTMVSSRAKEIWSKIYAVAGARDENDQKAVRAAVYTYCALNGTSRVGNYGGVMHLANGRELQAAVIPRYASKDIRKFLREKMEEAYNFFVESRVMEDHSRFIARAANLHIAPADAFAMADWMSDCPMFTPAQKAAHDKSFNYSIERSRRARDGQTLERVEDGQLQAELSVQGPSEEVAGPVKW